MIPQIGARHFLASFGLRHSQKNFFQTVLAASALSTSLSAGVWMLNLRPLAADDAPLAPATASAPAVVMNPFGALLVDMRPHARVAPIPVASISPPERDLEPIAPLPAAMPPAPVGASSTASLLGSDPLAPLPPHRPAEFGWPTTHIGSLPARASNFGRRSAKAALAATPSESPGLFETFFGALQPSEPKPSGPALAYAAPESDALDRARRITSGPQFGYDRQTAVYDISARTVSLPDGTKLEAHSGLGDKLDDPRYVHVRMRGATPPHVYELTLRERLFHGVQALRLNPIGEGHIFGRTGLLAHTYMLGPRGDSNGCVSIKNYGAFLRAFQNGEIKRLVVVDRAS